MVLVLPGMGVFSSAAFLGRLFSFLGIVGLFLLSWSHKGFLVGDAVVDSDGRFRSEDMGQGVVVRKERYLFYFLESHEGAKERDESEDDDRCDNQGS